MKTRLLPFLLLILLLAAAGCPPQPTIRPTLSERQTTVAVMIDDLSRADAEELTTKQLQAMVGEPEMRVSPDEMLDLLRPYDARTPGYSEQTVSDIFDHHMAQVWLRTRESLEPGNWKDSASFKATTLWLYKWQEPDLIEVVVCGFPFSHTSGRHRRSYYFIVDDGRVLSTGWIHRPE